MSDKQQDILGLLAIVLGPEYDDVLANVIERHQPTQEASC